MTSFMWKQENSDSRILVLIPAYEPGERLLLLIDGLRERTDYGIVLVDDGSGGACAGIFEKAAEKGCAVLKHEKNRGKGATLMSGFCWIQENRRGTEVIVTADCDGQHTVKDIVRVAESVRPGSRELVLGSRTSQGEVPKKSRIGNMISRKMFALFTGVEVWDIQTGLRGFPSALLPWLLSIPGDRFEYEQNMLFDCRRQGCEIREIPIETVYENENRGTHFHPIRDSLLVAMCFLRFSAVSLFCAVPDFFLVGVFYNLTSNLLLAGVLLISVSLAAGVIRLARMKILVQNIYSLETLAHVDTLCLDKTGTITDGKLQVCGIIPVQAFEGEKMDALIRSYMAASDDNNATFQALRQSFSPEAVYEPVHKIPFSSKRKWGSVSFAGKGTIFVGAPEKLMGGLSPKIEQELEKGRRAVAIGWYSGSWENAGELPEEILPLYSVILEDTIRRNAAKTLEFFHTEGVDVKIISGDHVRTVSMIAKRAGLRRWMEAVDMSVQGENPDYDRLCAKYAVFARVTPAQKKELVLALKRQGRQVAMTGDGVNDLLALREADCSIAVADGSDASRQISHIVLLDSDFTNLPQVVMEGRKVIHNVTRTAGVFFIKTIYSVLVSAFCLLFNQPFPFIPIQITLVDACIEAFPSFVTILESDTRRIQGSFLRTALSHALPYGLTVTGMIILMSLTAPFSQAERQTVIYLLLVLISMVAVIRSCIPFTKLRMLICGVIVAGTGCALALFPSLLELQAVTLSMGFFGLSGGALCLLSVLVLDRIRVLFFSENVRMPSEAGWQK